MNDEKYGYARTLARARSMTEGKKESGEIQMKGELSDRIVAAY